MTEKLLSLSHLKQYLLLVCYYHIAVIIILNHTSYAAGVDFDSTPINVTFSPGQRMATVQISTFNKPAVAACKSFNVTLSTNGSNIDVGDTATVKIIDNNGNGFINDGSLFIIYFTVLIKASPYTYNVKENAGAVRMRLVRSGDENRQCIVNVTTTSGSADGMYNN